MKPHLIFVYNADGGYWNGLKDLAHKTFSPDTYPCRLCDLTYSGAWMRSDWQTFVESLPATSEFLHKDEMEEAYGSISIPLPAVFQRVASKPVKWISAMEMNACTTLSELEALVLERLKETV